MILKGAYIGQLALFLLVVFTLLATQNLLGYFFQIRQYQKMLRKWLGKGILGVGQRRGLFTPGEIVILVYNPAEDKTIIVRAMRGYSVFAAFKEKPEYAGLPLKELRAQGIKEDLRDMRFLRIFFRYKPNAPTKLKGALIQAVEGVEEYLKNRVAIQPVPASSAEWPNKSKNDKKAGTGLSFDTLDTFIERAVIPALKAIVPPLLLGSVIFILLLITGLGTIINNDLEGFVGTIPALLIICAICLIPSLSPLLGPGILIAFAAGILTGEQIAAGAATIFLALPALFAIDVQIGSNFIPPRLTLRENEPETINAGVPGIVFTRLITIPVSVILAYVFMFIV